jgi:hypothetical protein
MTRPGRAAARCHWGCAMSAPLRSARLRALRADGSGIEPAFWAGGADAAAMGGRHSTTAGQGLKRAAPGAPLRQKG